MIQFFAPGIPKAQPRPRAFARKMGNRFVARVYDAGTSEGWKGDIAIAARQHLPPAPLAGPISLDIDFFFPRPACLRRRKDPDQEIPHAQKPDIDNAAKAVMDCLVSLGFIIDDGQVWKSMLRKFFVAKGAASGARITIREIDEDENSAALSAEVENLFEASR